MRVGVTASALHVDILPALHPASYASDQLWIRTFFIPTCKHGSNQGCSLVRVDIIASTLYLLHPASSAFILFPKQNRVHKRTKEAKQVWSDFKGPFEFQALLSGTRC